MGEMSNGLVEWMDEATPLGDYAKISEESQLELNTQDKT